MTGPLDGVSVVEMTIHRAGPFCGALLADMGADVTKIERPTVGDAARWEGIGPDGKSAYFMTNNRNKKSVTVDLKTDAGTEAALKLLEEADVFLENFGFGVAEKLGLGYDAVRERNPDIVYASIKGYGETGPLRGKPGLDLILQAEGGMMSVTGPENGNPVKVGQAIGDLGAGMFATIGVLARLQERELRSPTSGKFDVGLFDTIVRLMDEYITEYSMDGSVPGPQGLSHQTIVPYQLFETSDGEIVTGLPSNERWPAFVDVVGVEELQRYDTNESRIEHKKTIIDLIQEEFRQRSTDYWTDTLTEAGLPNGPLNDVEDVVDSEQAEARGLIEPHVDPDWGECLLPGHPINFHGHDLSVRSPAPAIGEHTDAVFAEVADNQSTLDEWQDKRAFGPTEE